MSIRSDHAGHDLRLIENKTDHYQITDDDIVHYEDALWSLHDSSVWCEDCLQPVAAHAVFVEPADKFTITYDDGS